MQYLQISTRWMSSLPECKELQIPCEIIRSARKTMAIQVTSAGLVVLRIPKQATDQEAYYFAQRHEAWIARQLRRVMEQKESAAVYSEEDICSYKEKLRPVLLHRVAYYAERMGVTYGRITIRNQKTRWGSCSAKGNLNFNWRLALLSEDLMDYVVVHELAHRREMNHSPRFWSQVEKVLPDYKERRRKLKEIRI